MYVYSKKNNAFYIIDSKALYETTGTWPDDSISVTDSVYDEFAASMPPDGKVRIAGSDGLPCWGDIPEATKEEIIAIADAQKAAYLTMAAEKIAPLNDAVELDMATTKEVDILKAWKVYRVLLTRIDTSTAPDIIWPVVPAA